MLNFVRDFAQAFDLGDSATRIGVGTFDNAVRNEFWMDEYNTQGNIYVK